MRPSKVFGGGPLSRVVSSSPVLRALGSEGGGRRVLGAFHEGGEVTKDGAYLLEKGEKVIPAADGKRNSEYRRLYLSRKKKKGEERNKK